MSTHQDRVDDILQDLRQMQDELQLRGSAGKNEWDQLEAQLRELEDHGDAVAEATGDPAECMDDVWTLVFEDLPFRSEQH
jgi:hypothetical protein